VIDAVKKSEGRVETRQPSNKRFEDIVLEDLITTFKGDLKFIQSLYDQLERKAGNYGVMHSDFARELCKEANSDLVDKDVERMLKVYAVGKKSSDVDFYSFKNEFERARDRMNIREGRFESKNTRGTGGRHSNSLMPG